MQGVIGTRLSSLLPLVGICKETPLEIAQGHQGFCYVFECDHVILRVPDVRCRDKRLQKMTNMDIPSDAEFHQLRYA